MASLKQLKARVENLKNEKAKAQGQLESCLQELSNDFDCDTIQEAQTKLNETKLRMGKLEKLIETEKDKLESDLDEWENDES